MDAVITTVDYRAPGFVEKVREYHKADGEVGDARPHRYRRNAPLRSQIRLIRKNLAFIETVYVVVQDESHVSSENLAGLGDVKVVRHDQFMPEDVLPTFCSTTIEMFLHRIPGLSEEFLYFNDDVYVAKPVSRDRFIRDGKIVRWSYRRGISATADWKDPYFSNVVSDAVLARELVGKPDASSSVRVPVHYPYPAFKSVHARLLSLLEEREPRKTLFRRFNKWGETHQLFCMAYEFMSADGGVVEFFADEVFRHVELDALDRESTVSALSESTVFCVNDTEIGSEADYRKCQRSLLDLLCGLSWGEGDGIRWSDYFDRIYCMHFLGYEERLAAVTGELRRVGILDSGIFEWRFTTKGLEDAIVADRIPGLAADGESNACYVNMFINYSRILREGKTLYRRFLVLEDDILFPTDLRDIRAVLDALPDKAGVVQFDPQVEVSDASRSDYGEWVLPRLCGDGVFFRPGDRFFGSTGCVAFTAAGASDVLSAMERTYKTNDRCLSACATYVAADRHLAIQNARPESSMCRMFGQDVYARLYGAMGVDTSRYGPAGSCCFVIALENKDTKHYDMAAYAVHTLLEHNPGASVAVVQVGEPPADSASYRYLRKTASLLIRNRELDAFCRECYLKSRNPYASAVFARLKYPDLEELSGFSRIVSFDSDMEFAGSLGGLATMDLPHGIGMAREAGPTDLTFGTRLRAPCLAHARFDPEACLGRANPYGKTVDSPVYNAGIIVYDRSTLPPDFHDRVDFGLGLHRKSGGFAFLEQDLLNMVLDIDELPPRYNHNMRTDVPGYDPAESEARAVVRHYVWKSKEKYMDKVREFAKALAGGAEGPQEPGSYGERGRPDPVGCPAEYPRKLKVNVYAITKNEAKFVDRWMDSMSEADGVYVLDTGSTDDTVEKLKARGAHVEVKTYDPWRFDVPRNDSMALCPEDTDVYVCTDLDEVLNKGWRKTLEDSWNGYVVKHGKPPTRARYDYVWGWEPDGKTPKTKFRYEKIHDANYKWKSPVHEVLVRRDESKPERWLETRDIVLEHHPDPSKSRGSYLGLLELAVKEDPSDARITHYLAREYGYRGRWDDAIKWHRKYLEMSGWEVERAASMKMLGTAYWNKGDRDLAELWFRRGAEEAPGQRESEFEWAGFLVRSGDWPHAADVLMRMLARTGRAAPPVNYVTDLSAWGAPFYDRLGMALWYSGRKDEARAVYKVACLKYPGNDHLRRNLRNCGESEADKMAAALLAAWPEYKQEKETK